MKQKLTELKGTVYSLEIMLASIIYSAAFLLRNPKFYPALLYIIVAVGFSIYLLISRKETFDERGKQSFMMAGAVTFFILFTGLVALAAILMMTAISVQLTAFLMLISVAAILLVHGLSFLIIDSVGKN